MSLFVRKVVLEEKKVSNTTEDDNFDLPDDTSEPGDTSSDDYSLPEDEGEEDTEEEPTEDNPDEDNFDLPEEDEGEEDTEEEPSEEEPTEDNPDEDNFDLPEDGEESESEEEPSEEEPSSDTDTESQTQELEAELFKDLTPEQMAIKNGELIQNFVDLYDSIDSVLSRLDKVPKIDYNIDALEYAESTLNDLRDILYVYINRTYKTKSYIENSTQLIQFMTVLDKINSLLTELKQKEENKK